MNSLIFVGDATPMEALLFKMLESSPIAVALLLVFWIGLKHIEKKDKALEETQKIHRETFERLHAACDEQQERSRIIIGECKTVMGSIDSTLKRIEAKG